MESVREKRVQAYLIFVFQCLEVLVCFFTPYLQNNSGLEHKEKYIGRDLKMGNLFLDRYHNCCIKSRITHFHSFYSEAESL